METLNVWLEIHGPELARLLDARREPICDHVAKRLAATYPGLCSDVSPDPDLSQQRMFQQTPQRFHTMLLAALTFRALVVIEREYRWLWGILPRYGVERTHMLEAVRWYFEAARTQAPLSQSDQASLRELEAAITDIVARATSSQHAYA